MGKTKDEVEKILRSGMGALSETVKLGHAMRKRLEDRRDARAKAEPQEAMRK